jgi:hypothetical protein
MAVDLSNWKFVYTESAPTWLMRIRIWWWLKRCEWLVKRYLRQNPPLLAKGT